MKLTVKVMKPTVNQYSTTCMHTAINSSEKGSVVNSPEKPEAVDSSDETDSEGNETDSESMRSHCVVSTHTCMCMHLYRHELF